MTSMVLQQTPYLLLLTLTSGCPKMPLLSSTSGSPKFFTDIFILKLMRA